MIGDGQSTLSDSTLMNLPKKELVDIIRLLEKNCKVYLNNLNTYSGIVKELTEVKENLIEFEEEKEELIKKTNKKFGSICAGKR